MHPGRRWQASRGWFIRDSWQPVWPLGCGASLWKRGGRACKLKYTTMILAWLKRGLTLGWGLGERLPLTFWLWHRLWLRGDCGTTGWPSGDRIAEQWVGKKNTCWLWFPSSLHLFEMPPLSYPRSPNKLYVFLNFDCYSLVVNYWNCCDFMEYLAIW